MGMPVAGPETSERGGGGGKNMKYKPLHLAAIPFMTFFIGWGGVRGGHLGTSPGSATEYYFS